MTGAGSPAASPADTCAVVVNYRCAGDTERCIESLQDDTAGLPCIVVDNDSGDGSADRLESWAAARSGVTVLRSPVNGGFGAGCNLGIERALRDAPQLRHVLLVNPDATARPGMLAALLDCAREHPEAGVVGGLILLNDGRTTWFENGAWRPWTLGGSHVPAPPGVNGSGGNGSGGNRASADEYDTSFVTGALMLLDADLLRSGLRFDERYFLYCEDMDLCRQVVARGRTLRITRRAVLLHASGGTLGDEPVVLGVLRASQLHWLTRNSVLLARKWLPWPQRWCALTVAWVLRPAASALRFRNTAFLGPYFRALREGHRAAVRDEPATSPRPSAGPA